MKMHLLSGGRLRMRRRIYYPDAAGGETVELPVSCALFRHAQGAVLFDTGCHPDAAGNGEGRWGEAASHSQPIFSPEDTVVSQLSCLGLGPGDVDVVVCSHLHYDHCGCNVFFNRATVICHGRELAAARGPDAEAKGYLSAEWDLGGTIMPIAGEHDLFGDGKLVLLPAPGHTPGMLIAHAVLDRSGAFVLASDAAPVSECLTERYAPRNTASVDEFLASLDDIARLQKAGAKVLYGHDDAQWRTLPKGAEVYD